MKKILLTGSRGFLGSYFVNNYSSKYDIKTFSFLKDDFEGLRVKGVDVVVYLSALVHQMTGASKEEYERVNVTQTLDLAKKAKESGIKHFIFMSTIAVYGIEVGIIYNDSKYNPITDYGKSKLKAEQKLLKLEDNNFKISIVRPPIVNGYNAPGNMKSLIRLVSKVPVLPFANIDNRRSMVYIGNLCHLVDEIIIQKKAGIFLTSDDEPLSTTKLIELTARNLERKVYLIKIPFFKTLLKTLKPSFYKRLYKSLEVDNSETKKLLNFKNPYSAEDGIKFMLKDYNK